MVPEIQVETDKKFCHYGPFFALLPPPPHLPNDPENQNFEKTKKMKNNAWRYYLFIHRCVP